MAKKIQIFFKVLGIFFFHFINSNFSHFGEIWHTRKKSLGHPPYICPICIIPYLGYGIYIEREILQAGNCKAHLMTAPQIPQCDNKKFGAYLAFPPIYMWPFGMQILAVAMRHLPQAQLSFVLIPQFAGKIFLKTEALFRGNHGAKSKDFPSTQITCICCLRDQSRVQTNWEYSL